jgi:benzil reductase ((S)-benzoin forming)
MTTTTRHLTILTGASRGMGLAMAMQLLAPDRHLLCISRRASDELAEQASKMGAPLTQWTQDLADTTGSRQRLQAWLEGLDTKTLKSAPLDDCPPEDLANALRVGLEAPMQLTAAFLHATGAWVDGGWRGPRKVLNISSGLGRNAMAAQAPYCAAKAGMDHFTRCSALDEAQREHGARLVSLAPGVIDTDMQSQLRAGDPAAFPDRGRFVDLQRQGQLASPDTAAQRVLGWLERADFGEKPVADVRD